MGEGTYLVLGGGHVETEFGDQYETRLKRLSLRAVDPAQKRDTFKVAFKSVFSPFYEGGNSVRMMVVTRVAAKEGCASPFLFSWRG